MKCMQLRRLRGGLSPQDVASLLDARQGFPIRCSPSERAQHSFQIPALDISSLTSRHYLARGLKLWLKLCNLSMNKASFAAWQAVGAL